eukprot:8345388-Pyramimonas_sp.AAC.1
MLQRDVTSTGCHVDGMLRQRDASGYGRPPPPPPARARASASRRAEGMLRQQDVTSMGCYTNATASPVSPPPPPTAGRKGCYVNRMLHERDRLT